jgi:hypothetical protein
MHEVKRSSEMSNVGELRLDDTQMGCIIAAILTIASTGADTFVPKSIVKRYSDILEQLRQGAGSCVNPPS